MHKRFLLLLAIILSTPALAHEGAHGIVLQRMELMKVMYQEMKAIGRTLLGNGPEGGEPLLSHVQALHEA